MLRIYIFIIKIIICIINVALYWVKNLMLLFLLITVTVSVLLIANTIINVVFYSYSYFDFSEIDASKDVANNIKDMLVNFYSHLITLGHIGIKYLCQLVYYLYIILRFSYAYIFIYIAFLLFVGLYEKRGYGKVFNSCYVTFNSLQQNQQLQKLHVFYNNYYYSCLITIYSIILIILYNNLNVGSYILSLYIMFQIYIYLRKKYSFNVSMALNFILVYIFWLFTMLLSEKVDVVDLHFDNFFKNWNTMHTAGEKEQQLKMLRSNTRPKNILEENVRADKIADADNILKRKKLSYFLSLKQIISEKGDFISKLNFWSKKDYKLIGITDLTYHLWYSWERWFNFNKSFINKTFINDSVNVEKVEYKKNLYLYNFLKKTYDKNLLIKSKIVKSANYMYKIEGVKENQNEIELNQNKQKYWLYKYQNADFHKRGKVIAKAAAKARMNKILAYNEKLRSGVVPKVKIINLEKKMLTNDLNGFFDALKSKLKVGSHTKFKVYKKVLSKSKPIKLIKVELTEPNINKNRYLREINANKHRMCRKGINKIQCWNKYRNSWTGIGAKKDIKNVMVQLTKIKKILYDVNKIKKKKNYRILVDFSFRKKMYDLIYFDTIYDIINSNITILKDTINQNANNAWISSKKINSNLSLQYITIKKEIKILELNLLKERKVIVKKILGSLNAAFIYKKLNDSLFPYSDNFMYAEKCNLNYIRYRLHFGSILNIKGISKYKKIANFNFIDFGSKEINVIFNNAKELSSEIYHIYHVNNDATLEYGGHLTYIYQTKNYFSNNIVEKFSLWHVNLVNYLNFQNSNVDKNIKFNTVFTNTNININIGIGKCNNNFFAENNNNNNQLKQPSSNFYFNGKKVLRFEKSDRVFLNEVDDEVDDTLPVNEDYLKINNKNIYYENVLDSITIKINNKDKYYETIFNYYLLLKKKNPIYSFFIDDIDVTKNLKIYINKNGTLLNYNKEYLQYRRLLNLNLLKYEWFKNQNFKWVEKNNYFVNGDEYDYLWKIKKAKKNHYFLLEKIFFKNNDVIMHNVESDTYYSFNIQVFLKDLKLYILWLNKLITIKLNKMYNVDIVNDDIKTTIPSTYFDLDSWSIDKLYRQLQMSKYIIKNGKIADEGDLIDLDKLILKNDFMDFIYLYNTCNDFLSVDGMDLADINNSNITKYNWNQYWLKEYGPAPLKFYETESTIKALLEMERLYKIGQYDKTLSRYAKELNDLKNITSYIKEISAHATAKYSNLYNLQSGIIAYAQCGTLRELPPIFMKTTLFQFWLILGNNMSFDDLINEYNFLKTLSEKQFVKAEKKVQVIEYFKTVRDILRDKVDKIKKERSFYLTDSEFEQEQKMEKDAQYSSNNYENNYENFITSKFWCQFIYQPPHRNYTEYLFQVLDFMKHDLGYINESNVDTYIKNYADCLYDITQKNYAKSFYDIDKDYLEQCNTEFGTQAISLLLKNWVNYKKFEHVVIFKKVIEESPEDIIQKNLIDDALLCLEKNREAVVQDVLLTLDLKKYARYIDLNIERELLKEELLKEQEKGIDIDIDKELEQLKTYKKPYHLLVQKFLKNSFLNEAFSKKEWKALQVLYKSVKGDKSYIVEELVNSNLSERGKFVWFNVHLYELKALKALEKEALKELQSNPTLSYNSLGIAELRLEYLADIISVFEPWEYVQVINLYKNFFEKWDLHLKNVGFFKSPLTNYTKERAYVMFDTASSFESAAKRGKKVGINIIDTWIQARGNLNLINKDQLLKSGLYKVKDKEYLKYVKQLQKEYQLIKEKKGLADITKLDLLCDSLLEQYVKKEFIEDVAPLEFLKEKKFITDSTFDLLSKDLKDKRDLRCSNLLDQLKADPYIEQYQNDVYDNDMEEQKDIDAKLATQEQEFNRLLNLSKKTASESETKQKQEAINMITDFIKPTQDIDVTSNVKKMEVKETSTQVPLINTDVAIDRVYEMGSNKEQYDLEVKKLQKRFIKEPIFIELPEQLKKLHNELLKMQDIHEKKRYALIDKRPYLTGELNFDCLLDLYKEVNYNILDDNNINNMNDLNDSLQDCKAAFNSVLKNVDTNDIYFALSHFHEELELAKEYKNMIKENISILEGFPYHINQCQLKLYNVNGYLESLHNSIKKLNIFLDYKKHLIWKVEQENINIEEFQFELPEALFNDVEIDTDHESESQKDLDPELEEGSSVSLELREKNIFKRASPISSDLEGENVEGEGERSESLLTMLKESESNLNSLIINLELESPRNSDSEEGSSAEEYRRIARKAKRIIWQQYKNTEAAFQRVMDEVSMEASPEALFAKAQEVFDDCKEKEIQEIFDKHARIRERNAREKSLWITRKNNVAINAYTLDKNKNLKKLVSFVNIKLNKNKFKLYYYNSPNVIALRTSTIALKWELNVLETYKLSTSKEHLKSFKGVLHKEINPIKKYILVENDENKWVKLQNSSVAALLKEPRLVYVNEDIELKEDLYTLNDVKFLTKIEKELFNAQNFIKYKGIILLDNWNNFFKKIIYSTDKNVRNLDIEKFYKSKLNKEKVGVSKIKINKFCSKKFLKKNKWYCIPLKEYFNLNSEKYSKLYLKGIEKICKMLKKESNKVNLIYKAKFNSWVYKSKTYKQIYIEYLLILEELNKYDFITDKYKFFKNKKEYILNKGNSYKKKYNSSDFAYFTKFKSKIVLNWLKQYNKKIENDNNMKSVEKKESKLLLKSLWEKERLKKLGKNAYKKMVLLEKKRGWNKFILFTWESNLLNKDWDKYNMSRYLVEKKTFKK